MQCMDERERERVRREITILRVGERMNDDDMCGDGEEQVAAEEQQPAHGWRNRKREKWRKVLVTSD